MNFVIFSIVALITFIITQTGATQIIGILFIKLPKKEFITIIGLVFWCLILIAGYFVITKWFNNYFSAYLWASIIAVILSLFNIKNLE